MRVLNGGNFLVQKIKKFAIFKQEEIDSQNFSVGGER